MSSNLLKLRASFEILQAKVVISMKKFHGSLVALLTPFKDGQIDEKAYADFIDWHIKQGTHGLVNDQTT